MVLSLSIFVSAETTIDVSASGDNAEVTAQVKDGEVSFDILYGDGSQFTHFGKDDYRQLKASSTNTITIDDDTDKYFVATYVGTNPESYLLEIGNIDDEFGEGVVELRNSATGQTICQDKKAGDKCYIGNVELNVEEVNPNENWVRLKITSGNFNKLYVTNGDYIKISTSGLPASTYSILLYDSSNSKFGEYKCSWASGVVKVEKIKSQTCTDSDGGIQKFIYGTVFYGSLQGSDVCEGGILNNVGDVLYERYCDEWGNERTEEITCELGCVDGVCRKSSGNDATTKILCEDTEGGKNYDKGGMVSHGEAGTPPSSMTPDKCIDSNTLKEVYCENGYYAEEIVNCPSGCSQSTTEYDVVHGIYFYNTGCNPLTSLTTCTESWTCTDWSDCANNQQTRTCTDSNNCGTAENKPDITKSCTSETPEDYHILEIGNIDDEFGEGVVELRNSATGQTICQDKKAGDKCYIGNVELRIDEINVADESVQIKILHNGILQKAYEKLTLNENVDEYLVATIFNLLVPTKLKEEIVVASDDICENVGIRKEGKYCSDTEVWTTQKETSASCENNFECDSNLCLENECVSGNLISRFLRWLKNLFS